MSAAAALSFSTANRAQQAARRLRCAAAVSALAHVGLGGMLSLDAARIPAIAPGAAPLQVRLQTVAPPPAVRAANLEAEVPAEPRGPGPDATARRSPPAPREAPAPPPVPVVAVLPRPADSIYYAAHELDTYPAPIAPLRFGDLSMAGAGAAAATLLLRVAIDEHGTVREVSLVEPAPPGSHVEAVRAAILAARFHPARKDGRAVKSRLLLSVRLQAERREP